MSPPAQTTAEKDTTRRTIFIAVGLATALLVAGVVYLVTRPAPAPGEEPRLEGALRPGSPEFDQYRDRIIVDKPEATESPRAIGDIIMVLTTTVRNLTGRTINGLEMRGAVVDLEGRPVRERTLIVIPARQAELGPNKTIEVPLRLEGFTKDDVRANIRMEVTGVKFK